MKLIERVEMLDQNERVSFWQFIESIKWSPGANCKDRLLKDLSPIQAAKYRHILNYICEIYAEELSINYNFNKIFESKAYCSNIIGEHGYGSLDLLAKNANNAAREIESQTFNNLEDIFLFMVPEDDDYWF